MSALDSDVDQDNRDNYALAIAKKRERWLVENVPGVKRARVIGDCELLQGDCLEVMPGLGPVDAVVTDPPYGVAMKRGDSKIKKAIAGDTTPPDLSWIKCTPAVVWGGNNFSLPRSTGWLVWFKHFSDTSHHSQAELAWTNCVKTVRHYSEAYHGFMRARDGWFHPTQKPPALMEWCLGFLPDARTILDPYMGSGTTLVACAKLGRRGIGIEIDTDYFDIACRRVEEAYRQPDLFVAPPSPPVQEGFDL